MYDVCVCVAYLLYVYEVCMLLYDACLMMFV